MTERDFVYWLNGFLELSDTKDLNEKQVKTIKEHLSLVLTKVTNNPDGTITVTNGSGDNIVLDPNTKKLELYC
jgi:hypothetical protein